MKAKDIMTRPVITASSASTVADAVHLMLEKHISALPVIDADDTERLVGIVSEGDLMRRVRKPGSSRRSWWLEAFGSDAGAIEEFLKLRSDHVSDVMTRNVISVEEDTPVADIARLLEKHRIKRVPVVYDGKVTGIVSRANLLHALSALGTSGLPEPAENDRVLRDRIHEALQDVPGVAMNLVNYTVERGKVSVLGVVQDQRQQDAIRVALENVSGVRSVDLHLGHLPAWVYGV